MAVQYTRKKETIDSETTFHITSDMVMPGMQVARPFEMEKRVTVVEDEGLTDREDNPLPAEEISQSKNRFSWLRFLGGLILAAVLVSLLVLIGIKG